MDDSDQSHASQNPDPPVEEQVFSVTADWTVEAIIAELEREFDGSLPVDAIRAAQKRRDEIIPHLIKLVERATALVRDGELPDGNGHLIAVYLLTEFRAQQALPAILDAVSLSGEDVDELFGDAIAEDFCRVFAVLTADVPDQIDALIANRSFWEIVRWEAAETYKLWVRDGRLTREQAVDKLRQHLRGAITNQDHELAGPLVSELDLYGPREVMDEIREAFRLGLVDESLIEMKHINKTLAKGDARWQNTLANLPPTSIADTVEELEQWWCYQDGAGGFEDAADYEYDEDYGSDDDDLANGMRTMMSRLDDPLALDGEIQDALDDDAIDAPFDNRPAAPPETIRRTAPRVGRNEPCPCASGKKFKKCCGKN